MSSIPVFILKVGNLSTRLTYSEASEKFGKAELDTVLNDFLALSSTKRDVNFKEFDMNAHEKLIITFNDRY